MKNDIIAESCRICLTKTKKLRSLYKPMDEGDEPPNKMLLLLTGIKVEKLEEFDMLPKSICKNCELSLSMAFEFRDNALKTNKVIMEYIKELYGIENKEGAKVSSSIYKNNFEDILNGAQPLDCEDSQEAIQNLCTEPSYLGTENDEEELNDSDEGEHDCEEKGNQNEDDDDDYNQSETYFHISSIDEQHDTDSNLNHNLYEQQQEQCTDDENYIKDEEHDGDFEYTQEQIEIAPAVHETYARTDAQKNLTEINSKKPKRKKVSHSSTKANSHKSDANLTQHMKLIPRRGRRPAKNTDQTGHICDICGNVFSKRGRMMEHRQRHDKECKFCCEICEKKFLTRELLRKHMFSHSGGKPLKCEFCSRTFYYESVRKAHEAVHKGLRPFICDVCGKCFSYAHALKKHKLIHAEIKLYRCEYCHKDFRLQHHMKQHELTKLHQNAVRFAKGINIAYEECEDVKGEQRLEEDILYIEEMADDKLIVSNI